MSSTGASATYKLNRLPVCVATASTSGGCFHFLKLCGRSKGIFSSYVAENRSKTRVLVSKSNQVSSLHTDKGTWEDPDSGSDGEYDEDDGEMEENDLGFESDWEEEKGDPTTASVPNNNYEEELAKGNLTYLFFFFTLEAIPRNYKVFLST